MSKLKLNSCDISNKKIVFSAEIHQCIEISSVKIFRIYPNDECLETYPQDLLNRNIYCYSLSGAFLWQVQEAPHGDVNQDKPYMNIWLQDDKVIASNWNGLEYIINTQTGEVSSLKKGVRPW